MSTCALTKKKRMVGNNRSHAKNATKRTFKPNMQTKRYFHEGQWIKLKLSTRAIRTIDKIGLPAALERMSKEEWEQQ